MGMGRSFENEVVQKHYDSAYKAVVTEFDLALKEIELAWMKGNPNEKWNIIQDFADELIGLTKFKNAKEFILKKLPFYDVEEGPNLEAAILYRKLAVIEYSQANYEEAFTHLYIAKAKCPPDEKFAELVIKNDFGIIYNHLNDLKQAEECFLYCFNEGKKILTPDDEDFEKKSLFINNILISLGAVYNRSCDYIKAKQLYTESLEVFQKMNDYTGIANIYNNLGIIEASLGNYHKSKQYFEKSVNLKVETQDIRSLSRGYVNLGECLLLLKEYDEAIKKTEEGLALARKASYVELIKSALEILTRTYEEMKDFEKAFYFLQEYKRASDDYNTRLHRQKLAELQVQYKTKEHEKDKEIYRLHNIELAQAVTVRDKLFSVIAHDLRGPINNIYSALELLQNAGELSPDELRDMLSGLYLDTKATIFLLDNLLQWGRNNLKDSELKFKQVNLLPILDSVISLNRTFIEKKGIILINKINEDIEVFCDKNIPSLVLRNILSNAIKFTPSGQTITLTASIDEEFTAITIADSGIGISQENIDKLFKLDMNKSTFGTNSEKGAGLGLYLCYDYIRKAGGDIRVKSIEGEGSEFTAYFPNNKDSFLKATEQSN
ncbi:MAG: tetratricopeptide repeat-containing sensor histidine kinase [Candidatus Cloacimonetes bacterium]|nr:tetratricopeptide repeat-containing sensor histidine kinase [Candidatus Cloacimonadota bacterium]